MPHFHNGARTLRLAFLPYSLTLGLNLHSMEGPLLSGPCLPHSELSIHLLVSTSTKLNPNKLKVIHPEGPGPKTGEPVSELLEQLGLGHGWGGVARPPAGVLEEWRPGLARVGWASRQSPRRKAPQASSLPHSCSSRLQTTLIHRPAFQTAEGITCLAPGLNLPTTTTTTRRSSSQADWALPWWSRTCSRHVFRDSGVAQVCFEYQGFQRSKKKERYFVNI